MNKTATPKRDKYDLDVQVGYLLRLAHQRHAELFKTHIIGNLTPTQFSALVRISQQGTVSQNHLGRLAGMDVATVKGVVERLKSKKLIVLEPDLQDRRRVVIRLSPDGQKLIPKLEAVGKVITEETLSPLKPSERRTLVSLLGKLV